MTLEQPPRTNKKEKMENIIEFKSGARKLRDLVAQLSGIVELGNDIKRIQAKTRAETAANILQEMSNETNELMFKFRKKVLYECRQGITVFEPMNDLDRTIKEDAVKIIDQLEAFEK